jgi:phosphopantothenate synthetase
LEIRGLIERDSLPDYRLEIDTEQDMVTICRKGRGELFDLLIGPTDLDDADALTPADAAS